MLKQNQQLRFASSALEIQQSAIAEGFAEANTAFRVITSAKILPR